MKTKSPIEAMNFNILCNLIGGTILAILFVLALISIAKGAWWHILTAVISGPIAYSLFSEIAEIKKQNQL